MSEVLLNDETIRRFRARYTATFGGNTVDDPLYGAVSAGQRFPGVEHWLPFFYEHLSRLARLHRRRALHLRRPGARGVRRAPDADRRLLRGARAGATAEEDRGRRARRTSRCRREQLYEVGADPYALAGGQVRPAHRRSCRPTRRTVEDAGGQLAPSFAAERQAQDVNLFEAVVDAAHARSSGPGGKTIIACWTEGSRDRMAQVLADHGLKNPRMAENWRDAETTSAATTALVVLGLETGFATERNAGPLRAGHPRRAAAAAAAPQDARRTR